MNKCKKKTLFSCIYFVLFSLIRTFVGMKVKWLLYGIAWGVLAGCGSKQPKHTFTQELLMPMTPVKNQGKSELCWAYAMLATIETEHLLRGDSVNLSATYVGRVLSDYQRKVNASRQGKGKGESQKLSQRGMGQTLLNIIQRYGIVPYDVLPDQAPHDLPVPQWVFMLGARYTPLEFAHSVCAPEEYLSLTCWPDSPYYKKIEVPVPDNWEHNKLLNLPLDTLRMHTDRAIMQGHPVCWESRGHAMSIVGIARDENHRPYYIMKNSWGPVGPHEGLVYMSLRKMWKDVVALYMTNDAYNGK